MPVSQIVVNNQARNFNYLIGCEKTGLAAAIDPLDARACIKRANELGWQITHVFNTHEHWDHIGGNAEIIQHTGAQLFAPARAHDIDNVDQRLYGNEVIKIGESIALEIIATPGHTMSHLCLFEPKIPCLFAGDTLFNAGCGNCHRGGCPEALYHTLTMLHEKLPPNTLVYPGHDYVEKNLAFAQHCEPMNPAIIDALKRYQKQQTLVSTLADEQTYNPFLRLSQASLIENLIRENILNETSNEMDVFLALRSRRDHW